MCCIKNYDTQSIKKILSACERRTIAISRVPRKYFISSSLVQQQQQQKESKIWSARIIFIIVRLIIRRIYNCTELLAHNYAKWMLFIIADCTYRFSLSLKQRTQVIYNKVSCREVVSVPCRMLQHVQCASVAYTETPRDRKSYRLSSRDSLPVLINL